MNHALDAVALPPPGAPTTAILAATPIAPVVTTQVGTTADATTRAAARRRLPISPPTDGEVWSYVQRGGEWFMPVSALSKICLGMALVFLGLRGDWLQVLLPFALMMVLSGVISLVWSTQIEPFDHTVHDERRRRPLDWDASVDVFIMTCGEDADVVENTIMHATQLRHRAPVHVYVLDDAASDDIRARAARWGVQYLTRPDRGWMKKAGNLGYGYERTSSALILVLDADFAVRPDFLAHTVPYFDDPTLAILQTPQYFRVSDDNWVERGAAAQQEQFYRLGMRARDKHQGAICVGTNAVYRREALDTRGGMALLEHSEDIFTGMKVIDAGYRVAYLPLPLAAGSTPDSVRSLASQQYRWARGNFALAGTPLFKRMRLTFMQRLGIWDGWIFYVTSALSPVVALFVPIVALAEAPDAITLAPTVMVLPALVTEFVLQPRWLFLSDGRASRRVGLISQVAHLYALRDHLTDRDQEWIPTGGARSATKQGTDRIPDLIAAAGAWGFAMVIALLVARILTGWALADLAPVGVLAAIALPAALGVAKPAVEARRDGTRSSAIDDADGVREGRDGFLDLLRAASIVRVMFWHALGYWWISWAFAAMPAVFYVSGAVLATSMQRRGARRVVRDRLRRLLPPYAAFVGIALLAVIAAEPSVVRDETRALVSWIVPYRSPAALSWEEGWLSTPLWFLRALVLVLLLTPPVRWVGRRVSGYVTWPVWGLSLVGLDVLIARQTAEEAVAVVRGVGDIVCFGGFFALGAVAHHRRYRWSRPARLCAVAVLVMATAVVTVVAPPAERVVNNSYVLFGLVGLVWIVAMLAFEDHLRQVAGIPAIARFIGWITAGSMSIYLWHTFALCIAYWLIGGPSSLGELAVLIGVFAMVLAVVVPAVRPLEGLGGGGRSAPVHPGRVMAVGIALLVLVGQPSLFPSLTEIEGPPVPSGRPAVAAARVATPVEDAEAAPSGDDAEAWMAGHAVDAAAVAEIGRPGEAPGLVRLGDPDALDADAPFEALSVTKTMVAAVALQLVEEGAIVLDDPLPGVDGVPEELTDSLTMRRLLAHATGLRDYREVEGFNPDMVLTPAEAVSLSASHSDTASTEVSYAATNYLLAGLVIERVTGQPLSDVLDARLFEPLGLDDTELVNNTRQGFVGQGSGGVVSTLSDLAIWYDALLRGDAVLSDDMQHELLYGGVAFSRGTGLGSWRRCPCDPPTAADPEPFLYAFHDGGDVRVVYVPGRGVVMAIRFSRPLYDERRVADGLDDFVFAVADLDGEPVVASAGDEG